ncbi:unnamed protein product [marine sediment metagenome]|uniref:Uncharacterized protein n=1 Tax=marine sediment metagenome TaxID=412755 RepID=X1C4G0_9ZZZZ
MINTDIGLQTVGKVTFTGYPGIQNIVGTQWRLIHDGKVVRALVEGSDDTVTTCQASLKVIEFDTEKGCLDEVKRLGLEYKPEEFDK